MARCLTDVLSALSIGPRAATGISAVSSSPLHQFVLGAGRFADYSFAPWQAVRWASSLARAMPFICLVISLVGTVMDRQALAAGALIAASRETRAHIVKDGDAEITAFTTAYHEAIISPMQQILLDLTDYRVRLTQHQLTHWQQSLTATLSESGAAGPLWLDILQPHGQSGSLSWPRLCQHTHRNT